VVGDVSALRGVRYVITLDADTQLPHDAAHELVATMRHPLNRARIDPVRRCVVSGYGILQPRVGTTLSLAGASRYAMLFGGDPGLDPYTRAVSDVYQDLFAEGSFTGKGIYDVDAFEQSLGGRLPDNRILSHDLLEGCYARAGLVSDVALFEDYPQRYDADMKRRHRWIRGDWQIARWLWFRVPRADGAGEANPLSPLSRWKIFDNLRRSLVAPALLALLTLGWTLLPDPLYWTAFVLCLTLVPVPVEALLAAARKAPAASWRQHLGFALRTGGIRLEQALFGLACLPFEALLAIDAIGRTLWRQHVSRRRLLEWTPSRVVESEAVRRASPARCATCSPGRWRRRSWPCWSRGSDPRRWHSPRRSWDFGCSRRCSRGGRADRRAPGPSAWSHDTSRCCGRSRAARGTSSRSTSAPTTTGCRRTTTRNSRAPCSRTGPRPPTSDSVCSPRSRRTTSATCRSRG
jgi:hypothetical protein